MHETGVIRRLIESAQAEARKRGAPLRGIYVRLGALAGGSPDHLREHFETQARELGLETLELHIESDPDRPSGVEITGIDLGGEPE